MKLSMKHIIFRRAIIIVSSLLFIVAASTAAAKSDDGTYTVKADEVVERNVTKAAQTVEIDGTVKGDLIVAAQNVRVNGTIEGDLIAAANNIHVSGNVLGNVRVAGNLIQLDGTVGKNVNVFGSTVIFDDTSTVGWSVFAAGASVTFDGTVNGHVDANGETITLNGKVVGDLKTKTGSEGRVSIQESANVGGDVLYSGSKPSVDESATIAGDVRMTTSPLPMKDTNRLAGLAASFFALFQTVSLVATMIVALLAIGLFRKTTLSIITSALERPGQSFGWGAAVFFLTPILVVLLAVTLVGIPLAAILGVLYGVKLYLAKVALGILVGYVLLTRVAKREQTDLNLYLSAAVGVLVLGLVFLIPILGALVIFVGVLWMLGAMLMALKGVFMKSKA
ncbi:MAG: hypothetical protein HYV34_01235 [Candidatus Kerfeldbacteria bacterium]|nr:hypothetical protein [Candidatus Kerfeldbacteria bacterium]